MEAAAEEISFLKNKTSTLHYGKCSKGISEIGSTTLMSLGLSCFLVTWEDFVHIASQEDLVQTMESGFNVKEFIQK